MHEVLPVHIRYRNSAAVRLDRSFDTNYSEGFVLDLQEGTLVQRDKKRVPATELEVGRSVVVDVSGDTLYDEHLFVISVTLVPSTTAGSKK